MVKVINLVSVMVVSASLFTAGGVAADPPKLALLVGCTEYPNNARLRELYGPANDVPMWAALLTDPDGFAFPDGNVTRLVGWPADPDKRPTHANIVKGFEALIARAEAGSRVVIVLSGHGVQVPIPNAQADPLDPKNPEPDGLDEVFLPADVRQWDDANGLAGAITDNQVGEWLDKLRGKGAHVLAVFDCCHAGTMTRGGPTKGAPDPNTPEVSRVADRAALGVTPAMVERAAARAKAAVEAAKAAGKPLPAEATVAEKPGRGSLVAFYAAQPFEEAPELPLPDGKPVLREHYYGLLSYTLVQAIRQRQSGLTYGELQRVVASAYRAARATRPPTPFAEGDLSREVLGLTNWPNRPAVFLRREKDGGLRVDAGALHGLTPGSVLAVRPLGGAGAVLGHVRVDDVGPSSASVVPAEFDGKPALPAGAVKESDVARCELVRKDFGDFRVKVFADGPAAAAVLAALPDEPKAMARVLGAEPEADWVLRVVTPAQAVAEYGIRDLTGDEVFLVQGAGRTRDARAPKYPKVFGRYPAAERSAAVGGLARDLPKVFTWQNVWRVANGVSAGGAETHGLTVEVVRLKRKGDVDGEVLRNGVLTDGQRVRFRAENKGREDLWVTGVYLDANLGIHVLELGEAVGRGKAVTLTEGPMTTKDGSAGLEGLVVFAVPVSVQREKPDFRVLAQEPIRVADRPRTADRGPRTPFGSLLKGAAVNKGTGGLEQDVPTTPAILTQSWVLVP